VNSPVVVRHANVDAILTGAGRRTPSHSFFPRRGAGVAEQGCLLSSYPDKIGIGGSNPPLSASIKIPKKNARYHDFWLLVLPLFNFPCQANSKRSVLYIERERDRDMAAPEIYERLRGNGYPWKRVKDRYKNGQPKISPDSFQYALRYTLDGGRWFPTFKTVEDLTVALGRVQVQIHAVYCFQSPNSWQVIAGPPLKFTERRIPTSYKPDRYADFRFPRLTAAKVPNPYGSDAVTSADRRKKLSEW
jgi:hypothetical protein